MLQDNASSITEYRACFMLNKDRVKKNSQWDLVEHFSSVVSAMNGVGKGERYLGYGKIRGSNGGEVQDACME